MIRMKRNPALPFVVIVCLLSGCATQKFAGVEEYKQVTRQAQTAVQNSFRALEQISDNTGHCTPKMVATFQDQLQRLQVDSVRLRARARAIRARGDAYFASWSESIANIKDPRIRETVNRRRPEIETSFSKIKLASHRAGAAFDPFLSGLQKLRIELELRPGDLQQDSDRKLTHDTLENGRQVLKELGLVDSELSAIKKMLTAR